jgi:hypothetical protein
LIVVRFGVQASERGLTGGQIIEIDHTILLSLLDQLLGGRLRQMRTLLGAQLGESIGGVIDRGAHCSVSTSRQASRQVACGFGPQSRQSTMSLRSPVRLCSTSTPGVLSGNARPQQAQ